MRKFYIHFVLSCCVMLVGIGSVSGQLAASYTFTQSTGTFTPAVPSTLSSPASIFSTSWDDNSATVTIPFTFTYNGTGFTQATISANGFLVFGSSLSANNSGAAYVSSTNSDGLYFSGTVTNPGIAGMNVDMNEQTFTTFTGATTNGSPTVTGVSSFTNISIGTRISGTNIPTGTIVSAFDAGAGTVTMSANATGTSASVTFTPRSAVYVVTTGTAPNRSFTVNFIKVRRYNVSGDNLNFQIVLNEGGGVASNQTIQTIYGTNTIGTGSNGAQVGLRTTTADYNIRTSATDWTATTAGSSNTDRITLSSTVTPPSGLTYTWTPPVLAPCATPSDQATALNLPTISSTSIGGSFTAAASAPSGYLVIRSVGAFTGTLVDGTVYSAGNTVGNGTVVQSASSSSFTASSLTANTAYTFTVFSYNAGACSGGPKYNSTSPLTASATTCPATPASLSSSNVSQSGFKLDFTSSKGGGATPVSYNLEIATDAAFTLPVSGSPFTFNDTTTVQSTMSYSVSGLTSATVYYYRIKANGCNTTTASGSVTTACAATTSLPYNEGFESITTANTLPLCISASPTPSSSGKTRTYTASATGTNSALVARTGNKFAAVYWSPSNTSGWFFSAPIQLTGGVAYKTSVWYKTDGTAWSEAGLYYGTSASVAAMTTNIVSVANASATSYTEITGTFTPSVTGVYYVGIKGFNATTSPNYIAFDDLSVDVGPTTPCAAPTDQATGLTFGTATGSSQPGSFTAAGSAPSGYLIVRSVGAFTGTPVNGTTYNTGGTLGNGTVVQSGSAVSFTASGLTGNTDYTYTVIAFNNTNCLGGPVYNLTSPLTGNATTCPATPSPIATGISPTDFVISWISSKGGNATGPIDYTIEVTTNSTYTTHIPGSPFTLADSTTVQNRMNFAVTGLSANTTYYYRVKASGCNSTYGTGSTTTGTGTPPDCTTGTVLTECTTATASFTSGTGAWTFPGTYPFNSIGFSTPGKETVYRFTPSTTGVYYLEITAVTNTNYVDYFYKPASTGCGATGWMAIDDNNAVGKDAIGMLQAGVEYYILLDMEDNTVPASQTFKICKATTAAPTTLNSCISTSSLGSSVPAYSPKLEYVVDADGNLIAALNFSTVSNAVGTVTTSYFVNGNALRKDGNSREYLNRNFTITTGTAPASPVGVTLYFLNSELQTLINDPDDGIADVSSINDLRVTKTSQTCAQSSAVTSGGTLLTPTATGAFDANVSYVTVQVPSFSTFYLHGGLAVLPANLLSFAGNRTGNVNQLKWTVAQEVDVQAYIVERSGNNRTWTTAGTVNSLGNTASQRSYGFADNNISGAVQYYRLRQVDRNGGEKLSTIVVIKGTKPVTLTLDGLFPNPALSNVSILVDAPAKNNVTILVVDAVGRIVKMQKASVEEGSNTINVNVAGLSQGSYMLKVTSENNLQTAVSKFIKE